MKQLRAASSEVEITQAVSVVKSGPRLGDNAWFETISNRDQA